ncbi:MAG: translation initiation factor IF-2 N-terminal domain-containing protein, partial [Actinomycetota bacterium]|nr:translation initiation factor IF-2 N-terminal domain-containing protein [Actinomycetota bacterium]
MATKKIRVYELARELGVENHDVVELANELKIGVKSHSSSIDDPSADRVRRLADSRGMKKAPAPAPEPEPAPEAKPARTAPSAKPAAESEPAAAPKADLAPAAAASAAPEPEVVEEERPAVVRSTHRVVRSAPTPRPVEPEVVERRAPEPEAERPAAAPAPA